MKNINQLPGDNLGGLEQFFYADADEIDSIAPAVNGVITPDILMKSGKVFYSFRPSQGTLGFKEQQKDTKGGAIFTSELKGYVPRDSPELQSALLDMYNRRLVVIYRDNNGLLKLVGDKNFWLTFEADLDTGTNPTNRNGISFSFKGEGPNPAPFYGGAYTVDGSGTISPPVTPPANGFCRILRGDGVLLATLLPGQDAIIESGFSFVVRSI
ncbi:hypothetical protein QNI16_07195 [Cytophagaceae bacterium YF14B1]|uniref:Uncharacterized protein n=1 Tax=Xanthocytophaga flava TaxID=3048013 RepID=A0AAE3QP31_9BACT|nr:hypothetical protein [Xanthocytophaga flavus]MDJ1480264.1 hypothetical protein [Xanthocytophaga flavus]